MCRFRRISCCGILMASWSLSAIPDRFSSTVSEGVRGRGTCETELSYFQIFQVLGGRLFYLVLNRFQSLFFKIQVQLLHVVKQILLPSSIDHDARPTRRLGLGLPSHGQVAKPFRALRHIATCRPRDDFYRLLSMELRAMFEDVWRDLRRDPVWSLESKMFQVHLHKRFFRIYSRLLFANNIRFVDLLCSSQKLVVPLLGQVLQRTYLRNMLSPWNELRLIGALKGGKKTRTSR